MATTLTEVETAITQVQTSGQSFTADGITYSRANLSALIQLRDKLLNSTARSAGQRPLFRGFDFTTLGYD
ncbi:MAG: hypothetical protein WC374_06355 [Phycisphaerae bacterium]|jgi:hypothetical protein